MIKSNLEKINLEIEKALSESARKPGDCRLVAVSKTQPIGKIEEAYKFGQRCFGENFGQEFRDKFAKLINLTDLDWHFIGRIQSNKIKYIVGKASLIHSVSSLENLKSINEFSKKNGLIQNVLIQINVSNEETKSGINKENFEELLNQSYNNIKIKGLMTMPPLDGDEKETRYYFSILRDILERFRPHLGEEFSQLSMGTSRDFVWAIREGATLVRIGTQIFGERNYKG